MEQHNCEYCKNEIQIRKKNAKYCSPKCYADAKRCRIYSISYSEHQILDKQLNCAICQTELAHYNYLESKRAKQAKHCIDHCHITGKVRGVICDDCNRGLGSFKDDTKRLNQAIIYLADSDSIQTQIVQVMRAAYKRNWVSSRDGNISVRIDNTFYITPSGVLKYEFLPTEVLKLDFNNLKSTALTKPSGELEMHRLLQTTMDFKGCRAVVHLHPTYTIAAMHKGFWLQDLAEQFPEVSRYTRVGPNVRILPVTSNILAQETYSAMVHERAISNYQKSEIDCDIVGQAGHGVTAIGKSPWDAFEHIERLEHICQIVLASGVSPK